MAQSSSTLREIRARLRLSQSECAAALGVALETYRAWDAGRRPAPEAVVERARTLKAKQPTQERVPLQVLADELGTSDLAFSYSFGGFRLFAPIVVLCQCNDTHNDSRRGRSTEPSRMGSTGAPTKNVRQSGSSSIGIAVHCNGR